MTQYALASVYAAVLFVIAATILIKVWPNHHKTESQQVFALYALFTVVLQATTVIDLLLSGEFFLLNGPLTAAFYTIEYSLFPIIIYHWYKYFTLLPGNKTQRFSNYHWLAYLPAATIILASASSYWTGFLFKVIPLDEFYVCINGDIPWLQYLLYLYILGGITVTARSFFKEKREVFNRNLKYILFYTIPGAIGSFVQIGLEYDYGFTQTAFIISALLIYLEMYSDEVKDIERLRDLAEINKKLKVASEAKSKFLFNMSHDIRTPMNAIIGYTNLLSKNIDDKVKCIDYIRKIERSSQFLLSLINNVLEMAQIENDEIANGEVNCNINNIEQALRSVFDEPMKEKGLNFIFDIKVIHTNIISDDVKLRAIFLNLISNAYKYTLPGGEVRIIVRETPSEQPNCAAYTIKVSDTGIGMSEEFLPTLFDEFSREKTSTGNNIEGTGLGMPIVKKYIEQLGGKISVESVPGKGTTFTITHPAIHVTEDNTISRLLDSLPRNPVFQDKRILMAEDNDLNAEIAIEFLKEMNIQVERANDGLQCIDMLTKSPRGYYDLILMDIQMPNMNGYEATRMIRSMDDIAKSRIPIFAMTANAFEEDKRESLKAGMTGHLSKPINMYELTKTLARFLE